MKTFLLAGLLAVVGFGAKAQAQPSSPKQFCSLLFVGGTVASDRQKIIMDYGQKSKLSPLSNVELGQEAAAVEAMDSGIQALNYMDQHGWQFVSHVNIAGASIDKFYFSRSKP